MNRKLVNKKHEKGQGLVEYALILVLVAIVVISALTLLGPTISGTFTDINTQIADGDGAEEVAEAPATNESCAAVHPDGYATGPGYPYPCYAPGVGGYNP